MKKQTIQPDLSDTRKCNNMVALYHFYSGVSRTLPIEVFEDGWNGLNLT